MLYLLLLDEDELDDDGKMMWWCKSVMFKCNDDAIVVMWCWFWYDDSSSMLLIAWLYDNDDMLNLWYCNDMVVIMWRWSDEIALTMVMQCWWCGVGDVIWWCDDGVVAETASPYQLQPAPLSTGHSQAMPSKANNQQAPTHASQPQTISSISNSYNQPLTTPTKTK